MEVFKEIVVALLKINSEINIDLVQMICYHSLIKIKAIVQDDSLSELERFLKIEEIVYPLEQIDFFSWIR